MTMPDIGAVLIHTLMEPNLGATHPATGYGLLRRDWSPKPAYCRLVAVSGGSWTGC